MILKWLLGAALTMIELFGSLKLSNINTNVCKEGQLWALLTATASLSPDNSAFYCSQFSLGSLIWWWSSVLAADIETAYKKSRVYKRTDGQEECSEDNSW